MDDPVFEYQFEVMRSELSYWEYNGSIGNKPDILRFLRSKPVDFLLQHLQNFIWSLGRLTRRKTIPVVPAPRDPVSRGVAGADPQGPGRFFLDVTLTFQNGRAGSGGGISRVCRELALAGIGAGRAVPVMIVNEALYPCFPQPGKAEMPLDLSAGDVYVIVDSLWENIEAYRAIVTKLKQKGVLVAVIIYDVIPLQYPGFLDQRFVPVFERTLREILALSHFWMGISMTTLDNLRMVIPLSENDNSRMGWFHLGAQFGARPKAASAPKLAGIFSRQPVFLSVGTVEPKKGYPVALDAFDAIWRSGADVQYVIIGGQEGWASNALKERVLNHPEAGKKLHWIRDASDNELIFAYQNAYCFLQASVIEGFGLPLIEAAHFGLPVIASDIPIFREIAGDRVTYFRVCDREDLASKITAVIAKRPDQDAIPYNSWDQSLQQLTQALSALMKTMPETQLDHPRRLDRLARTPQ